MKILLPLLLLALPAFATPRVGPLDGAKGPPLPAVAMPSLAQEEELPNTALPMALEAKGLLAAAMLEWARLEQDARGAERMQALEALTRLSLQQNTPQAAQAYLTTLQSLNSTYQPAESILVAQAQANISKTHALQQLQVRFPTSQASVAARWAEVWHQAHTGTIQQGWGLPATAQLQERLKFLRTKELGDYMLIVGLAVIPGAGHLFLQQWAIAAVLLLGWAVFGLAFLSACRHRHYAYAFVWAFPFMALWLNSPLSAAQAAEAAAHVARVQALQSWQDLRPIYIPAT
jgi:hypothetical protein